METDPILEAAKKDLAELDAKRAELRAFISTYESYKGSLSAVLGTGKPSPAANEIIDRMFRRSAPADQLMSAVHDILAKRGDALTLTALFDALVAKGIAIGGSNPKQNLSQKLSAHPKLKSYGKRGWYFADSLPPCLQREARLSEHSWEYEEGLDAGASRPLQVNGAADWSSA